MGKFDNVDLGGDKTMQRMIKAEQDKFQHAHAVGWNEAIQAAAKFLDDKGQSKHTVEATRYHQQLAAEIRKLDKSVQAIDD